MKEGGQVSEVQTLCVWSGLIYFSSIGTEVYLLLMVWDVMKYFKLYDSTLT